MTDIEKYLNLLDVAQTLDKETYAYQTIQNVMVAMYDELSESDIKKYDIRS
ncbi:hypothetical protein [Staphylococcus saprophyticus]|uniref:hypothetical protein n=1 Tax=Staphylococcus saprophyticus TaxID=29385 RepID=UPI001304C85C|nr:hypothetical protein [Staphylococcus saprophyticus]